MKICKYNLFADYFITFVHHWWQMLWKIEIILKIFLLPQKMSEMSIISDFKNFCIMEQWFYCDKWATYFICGGKKINALLNFFWFNPEASKTLFKIGQLVELLKDGESKMTWDKDKNVSWYRRFCNLQPKCSFFRKRKTPKNLFHILDILLVFSACWPAGQTPLITRQEVMVSSCPQCPTEAQPTPAKLTGHFLQHSLPLPCSDCLPWLPEPAIPVSLPETPNPRGLLQPTHEDTIYFWPPF